VSASAPTGERLNEQSDLFAIDKVRHLAAYAFAAERAIGARVLDFGCGSGYGAAELASPAKVVVGVDRYIPPVEDRRPGVTYVRADLEVAPLVASAFDLVVSFQVIEHLVDPTQYLRAIAGALAPGGAALISTPNILVSDRENPYHVHEYEADELRDRALEHFERVEMLGVGSGPAVAGYYEARLRNIRRIVRLDPLGLRKRLPEGLTNWLFAHLAVIVRAGIKRDEGMHAADLGDFPIAPVDAECLDLLAVCEQPRAQGRLGSM
jgi:SAM-dependent methyltransferase